VGRCSFFLFDAKIFRQLQVDRWKMVSAADDRTLKVREHHIVSGGSIASAIRV